MSIAPFQPTLFAHRRPACHREHLVVDALSKQPTQLLKLSVEHTDHLAGFGQHSRCAASGCPALALGLRIRSSQEQGSSSLWLS
jgi:hypothetical protein